MVYNHTTVLSCAYELVTMNFLTFFPQDWVLHT